MLLLPVVTFTDLAVDDLFLIYSGNRNIVYRRIEPCEHNYIRYNARQERPAGGLAYITPNCRVIEANELK